MARKKRRSKKQTSSPRTISLHSNLILLRAETAEELEGILSGLPAQAACLRLWGENGAIFPRSVLSLLHDRLTKRGIVVRWQEFGQEDGRP